MTTTNPLGASSALLRVSTISDHELRTALQTRPTILCSATAHAGQYEVKVYKHKGALNLIQVVLDREDSKTDELNIKLLDIWQRKYRTPLKQALEVFQRAVGVGAGAGGFAAAMGSMWQWLEKSKSAVSSAIAGSLAAVLSGYSGGATLSDSVGRITEAYLKEVNTELIRAGYPPVNRL
jgi:hypothetical protein